MYCPRYFWKGPRGIRSASAYFSQLAFDDGCVELHTNNMLRKPWTSSVVDGPPMFMKTMAVGPFEPFGTGVGAIVALPLLHCKLYDEKMDVTGDIEVARFAARIQGARRAIVSLAKRRAVASRSFMCCVLSEGQNSNPNNVVGATSGVKALTNGGSRVGSDDDRGCRSNV
jgi:hypothetical protein